MIITSDPEKAQKFLMCKGTASNTITLSQLPGRKHSEHGLPSASREPLWSDPNVKDVYTKKMWPWCTWPPGQGYQSSTYGGLTKLRCSPEGMRKQTLQTMPFFTTFSTCKPSAEDFPGAGVGKCCVAVLSAETSLLSGGLLLPDGSYTASPATHFFGWLLSSSFILNKS